MNSGISLNLRDSWSATIHSAEYSFFRWVSEQTKELVVFVSNSAVLFCNTLCMAPFFFLPDCFELSRFHDSTTFMGWSGEAMRTCRLLSQWGTISLRILSTAIREWPIAGKASPLPPTERHSLIYQYLCSLHGKDSRSVTWYREQFGCQRCGLTLINTPNLPCWNMTSWELVQCDLVSLSLSLMHSHRHTQIPTHSWLSYVVVETVIV